MNSEVLTNLPTYVFLSLCLRAEFDTNYSHSRLPNAAVTQNQKCLFSMTWISVVYMAQTPIENNETWFSQGFPANFDIVFMLECTWNFYSVNISV